MKTLLSHFHGGIRLAGHKERSMKEPVLLASIPDILILPLHQHIGEPAEPIVKVGDWVLKGQPIAHAKDYVSAPVHASSSGEIVAIEERPVPHPSGMSATCIVIKTDGADTPYISEELISPHDYTQLEPSALRNIIRDAGIVGLGGAGFPTFIKLNPGPDTKVETLILNGAECEPYITCDAMLMQEQPRSIIAGARVMRHALQAKNVIIAIEDNKRAAITVMVNELNEEETGFIRIVQIPTRYPAGGERQLIQVITGKEVPSNKLPINIGIVCHNVGTAAAIARAIQQQEPLISHYVTVTGNAVNRPRNMEVLIGTPIKELLTQCELDRKKLKRLIMGGPMMGFALQSEEVPVVKTTDCILAADKSEVANTPPAMPCIRCGECATVCPAQLLPQQLYWYANAKDFDKVRKYNLFDCIECGCCAYVCPSHIPLVQYYRFAKTEIWAMEREKQQANIARQRHEFHLYRLERNKEEDEKRRQRKKALLKRPKTADDQAAQALIQAAIARVKTKKTAQEIKGKNIDNLTETQQQAIKTVEARRAKLRAQALQDSAKDQAKDKA